MPSRQMVWIVLDSFATPRDLKGLHSVVHLVNVKWLGNGTKDVARFLETWDHAIAHVDQDRVYTEEIRDLFRDKIPYDPNGVKNQGPIEIQFNRYDQDRH